MLELLTDVPAGKLAIADLAGVVRAEVDELERAGVDAVVVAAGNVTELVGAAPPRSETPAAGAGRGSRSPRSSSARPLFASSASATACRTRC